MNVLQLVCLSVRHWQTSPRHKPPYWKQDRFYRGRMTSVLVLLWEGESQGVNVHWTVCSVHKTQLETLRRCDSRMYTVLQVTEEEPAQRDTRLQATKPDGMLPVSKFTPFVTVQESVRNKVLNQKTPSALNLPVVCHLCQTFLSIAAFTSKCRAPQCIIYQRQLRNTGYQTDMCNYSMTNNWLYGVSAFASAGNSAGKKILHEKTQTLQNL